MRGLSRRAQDCGRAPSPSFASLNRSQWRGFLIFRSTMSNSAHKPGRSRDAPHAPGPRFRGDERSAAKLSRSRDASSAPELCSPPSDEAIRPIGRICFVSETILFDSLPARMIPKSAVAVFGRRSCAKKKGSGAPKGALSNQCPRQARLARSVSRAPAFRRSRLRHSPPVPPDGSAPEPGFPRRWLAGVLPASPESLPRLSTLRADRSLCRSTGDPKPPGCGLAKKQKIRARAPHLAFAVTACRPERRPLTSETAAVIVIAAAKSKAFEFCSMNQNVLARGLFGKFGAGQ
jgi:hypothetical protein